MSNLDYPISVLEAEGGKILPSLKLTGNSKYVSGRARKLAGITRAINFLREERRKEIEKEIKEKAKTLKDKNIKL